MLSLNRDVDEFHKRHSDDVENPGPEDDREDPDPCAIRTVIVHLPPGAGNRDPLLLEDLDPEDGAQHPSGPTDGHPSSSPPHPPDTVTLEDETQQVHAPRLD
uniref:Protein E17A n=2 Tax=Elephant endotheliotropic herpesvirus 4 TaxID=548914 RepID=A0A0S2CCJ7_9BETA|nr:protein E17A [Elephant endotheliotropic herpesvirus 4]ALO22930.1 protein E17A [Elephant endotheliotropic herpesvirus 4A]